MDDLDTTVVEVLSPEQQLATLRRQQFDVADVYIDNFLDGNIPFRDVRQVLTNVSANVQDLDNQYLEFLTSG